MEGHAQKPNELLGQINEKLQLAANSTNKNKGK
jgi:hypothetical protein